MSPVHRLPVIGRGAVNTWECDQWGHLNVQFYRAKASDALAVLACQLGLPPSRLRGATELVLPVAERILFKRELRAGDIYVLRAGLRAIESDGALRVASRMINQDSGVEAAAFETRLHWTSRDGRDRRPWPEAVLAAATAHAAHGASLWAELPPPPPMARALPAPPELDRHLLTYRGAVESWECDTSGLATPRAHIARFNDAITHLFRVLEIDRGALHASGLGSAVLDYEIDYRQALRSGQAIEMRSGLLDAGDKVFHVFHYIVDSSSGDIITSVVVAALFFDLSARKAVPLPAPIRDAMARWLAALPDSGA